MSGILAVVKSVRHTTVKGSRATAAFVTEIISRATRNRTSRYVAPAGVDSLPLPGDYVFEIPTRDGTGNARAVGYADPNNPNISELGEFRAYARDSAGAIVGQLHMLNSGVIRLFNGSGEIRIEANGLVFINGALIFTDGVIRDAGNGGVTVSTHVHVENDSGGPTDPPTSGS